ncbi:hypothetical protein Gotur_000986 [Gossypium turneri]
MEFCGVLISGVLVSWWVLSVNGANLPPCQFPAIYNFGDSNSDTGGISAAFEPIRAPYGVPYFHKPSGRDSDGRLIIDFIAERLKLPYLHAYLNSLGANFRHGANFATGGSTIRRPNETIYEYGISPFGLDMQIIQFEQFKARATEMYNQAKDPSEKDKLPRPEDFSKALYTFDIGQNDLSVGFRKLSFDQLRASIPDIINQLASAVHVCFVLRVYVALTFPFFEDIHANISNICVSMAFFDQICANNSLLRTFISNCNFLVHTCDKEQNLTYQYVKIQHLYEQGGRSFWIHNTGPIGCLPVNFFYILNPEPGYVDQYGCVKKQNEMAMEFNRQLKDRVIKLRTELPEASITLVDVYTAKIAMIGNAKNLGMADPLKPCCGYHVNYDHVWCGNKAIINKTEVFGASCENPSMFVSWDGVHYTEAANQYVADRTLNGSLSDPAILITQSCHKQ